MPTTDPPLSLAGVPEATVTLSNSGPLILAGGTVYSLQGDALVPQVYQGQGTLVSLAKDEKGVLVVNEDNKMSKPTSSETAARPGATLCKWTNGRRNIRAKYCKDAWSEVISTFLHCNCRQ